MKKVLLIATAVSFLSSGFLNAQEIENGNFEEWESVGGLPPAGLWKKPKKWNATDKVLNDVSMLLAAGGFPVSISNQMKKSTDEEFVHEGEASVQLISKDLGETLGVTPCMMSNGKLELDIAAALDALGGGGGLDDLSSILTVTGGTPLLGRRADSIVVYINSPVTNEDSATIIVQAKGRAMGTEFTTGGGTVMVGTAEGFQRIVVPVVYADEGNTATDTLVIMISSSAAMPSGEPGSMFGATEDNTIYVDDISVYTSEGVSGITQLPSVDLGIVVYPNPADQYINFKNDQVNNGILVIYDLNGRIMYQEDIQTGTLMLDISKYAHGSYFYQIMDTDQQLRQTGQFVK